jgi:hypothetical protein
MKMGQNRKLIKPAVFLLTAFLLVSCVKYDADPFDGEILPRITGYSTGVTNDWLYFNLHTGDVFNETAPNQEITEGEQYDRLDWDLAFCGFHMRTNSGTSGAGAGGAIDLGYGNYDNLTSVSQLPAGAAWVTDTDSDVYVTYSQADWNHYLVVNNMDFDDNPWFDPNSGPQRKLTSGNPLLDESMSVSGPPMAYTPSYHTYVVRTADGKHYFKIQIVNWYNTYTEIGDTGGQMSYYCDELN